MIKSLSVYALAASVLVTLIAPAAAAKKPKGVFCEHFSQSVFIPISRFGKGAANKWRIGQKTYVTIAGGGRVKCTVS